MDYKRILLAALFVVAGLAVQAQVATVPFEIQGAHIYIRVKAGSHDSLRFVFDTGTTSAMIDSATAESIGISKENRRTVSVGGIAGTSNMEMAVDQSLGIGDAEINGIELVLANFSSLSFKLKTRLDGLLGFELMNKYVTRIDFERKQLSMYSNISGLDTTGYTGVPFEFNKGVMIPRFPISITLSNGETFTGRAMFDTGNAFSLLVSAPFSKFHDMNSKLGDHFTAWGLNRTAPDKVAMIRSMAFAGFSFPQMSIRLTDNATAEPRDGYLGILGIEVIQRFDVILDYGNKKIYLRPNSNFSVPFFRETPKQ